MDHKWTHTWTRKDNFIYRSFNASILISIHGPCSAANCVRLTLGKFLNLLVNIPIPCKPGAAGADTDSMTCRASRQNQCCFLVGLKYGWVDLSFRYSADQSIFGWPTVFFLFMFLFFCKTWTKPSTKQRLTHNLPRSIRKNIFANDALETEWPFNPKRTEFFFWVTLLSLLFLSSCWVSESQTWKSNWVIRGLSLLISHWQVISPGQWLISASQLFK